MMNIAQLKILPIEESLELINKDLTRLVQAGKNTNSFGKANEVDGLEITCSWSSITNHFGTLGYKLNRKNYQYELDTTMNVAQRRGEFPFTEEEIQFVKDSYEKSLEEAVEEEYKEEKYTTTIAIKEDYPKELRIKPKRSQKRTTSVSVYEDTWDKWNKFKDQYAYNPTDLLDHALLEFMEKYDISEEEIEETKEIKETEVVSEKTVEEDEETVKTEE